MSLKEIIDKYHGHGEYPDRSRKENLKMIEFTEDSIRSAKMLIYKYIFLFEIRDSDPFPGTYPDVSNFSEGNLENAADEINTPEAWFIIGYSSRSMSKHFKLSPFWINRSIDLLEKEKEMEREIRIRKYIYYLYFYTIECNDTKMFFRLLAIVPNIDWCQILPRLEYTNGVGNILFITFLINHYSHDKHYNFLTSSKPDETSLIDKILNHNRHPDFEITKQILIAKIPNIKDFLSDDTLESIPDF